MIKSIGYLIFFIKYLIIYITLFFITLEVIVHNCRFKGRIGSSTLIKCLFIGGDYEPSLVNFLKASLNKGDVFIDLGANEGYFSVIASKLVGDSGIVYSVEPSKKNCGILLENKKINNSNNIIVNEVAVGNKNEKKPFYICNSNEMLNSAFHKKNSIYKLKEIICFGITKQEVTFKTLDNIVRNEHKNLRTVIKIDIEEYEYDLLINLKNYISKKNILWIIETKQLKVINLFDRNRFDIYYLPADSVYMKGYFDTYTIKPFKNNDEVVFGNYIFIPKN